MNNFFRSAPIVGTIKNAVRFNGLQCMPFSSAAKPKLEKTMNTVTLLGRVGSAPQTRGNERYPVVSFSIATHVNFKGENGDWNQRTDWHQIAVFKESLREVAQNYVTKGGRVMVSGRLTYNEYTDKDGVTRTGTNIVADDITFFN